MNENEEEFDKSFYEEIPEELKIEVNTLIWEYSPAEITLEEAEILSIEISNKILRGA